MPDFFVYADEAGCLTFNRNKNVSKYFIIATIVTREWEAMSIGLQRLRKRMLVDNMPLGDYFHATTDAQAVRDLVYEEIIKYDFSIQATICEKSKAKPHVTASKARFYKTPWYFHCKIGVAPLLDNPTGIFITAASIGTKKEKASFVTALDDVQKQSFPNIPCRVDFRSCSADPCMQVADYCAWAIQRKWEKNDSRSYDLIKSRITREYDLWAHGREHYY